MELKAARADNQVIKRATDGAQAARIVAEAETLAAGQIPGVVELVGLDDDGEQPCLVATRVDGPDLGRIRDLSVEEVAGVVAAVATILADLHDLGVVHGSVMASHVLIGPDGRPVLCGFGYGGRVGDTAVADAPLPEGHADPAYRPGDPLAPAADVYALGAMLRALVTAAPRPAAQGRLPALRMTGGATRTGRPARSGRARALRSTDRPGRDALVAVADRATAADPRLRPGARALAAAVGVSVPGARLPRRVAADGDEPPARPEGSPLAARRPGGLPMPGAGTRTRLVLGVALAVAVVALVVLRLGTAATLAPIRQPPTAQGPAPPLPPATDVGPTTAAAPTRLPVTAPPNRACPDAAAPLTADTDADGCPEALRWNDGVLEAGDRRWVVGQPGDRVATADWSCSGRSTLALLRPATGEVFVFGQWAQAGHDLVGEAAGRVVGGFAIRAADLGDGCPRVAVDRGGGAPVTLPKVSFPSP